MSDTNATQPENRVATTKPSKLANQELSPKARVVHGVQLVMIEQKDCVYCRLFDREISEAYPKTDQGKLAPLRRVDLHDTWPVDLASITPDNFTPTFILVRNGMEVDRISGYPGDNFFWFRLDEMINKL